MAGQADLGEEASPTAVTVRFLTKRFIGEYSSSIDHVYRSTIRLEDSMTDVEVLDTCSKTCPSSVDDTRVSWADAFVVVYSICCRTSFHTARDLVTLLTNHRPHHHHNPSSPAPPPSSPPPALLLLGNMRDLEHRREVGVEEGHALALEAGCQYYEVSAADSALSVSVAFHAFLRQAQQQQRAATLSKRRRRSSLGSVSKKLGAMFGKNSSSSSSSHSGSAKDSHHGGEAAAEKRRMSLTPTTTTTNNNGHLHHLHHKDSGSGDSEKRRTSSVDIVDKRS